MDEKRLNELDRKLDVTDTPLVIKRDEARELIRLARLGFHFEAPSKNLKFTISIPTEITYTAKDIEVANWARQFGIPAIRHGGAFIHGIFCRNKCGEFCKPITEALAKLPEGWDKQ